MVTVHPPAGITTPELNVTVLFDVEAVMVPVHCPLFTVPVTIEIFEGVETVRPPLREIEALLELPKTMDQVVVPPEAILVTPKDWLIVGRLKITKSADA